MIRRAGKPLGLAIAAVLCFSAGPGDLTAARSRGVRRPLTVLRFTQNTAPIQLAATGGKLVWGTGLTLEARVYQTEDVAFDGPIAIHRANHDELWMLYGFMVSRRDEGGPATESIAFGVGTGQGCCAWAGHSAALPRRRWVHLAGVADGSFVRLYIDGALVGETPMQGFPTVPENVGTFDIGNHFSGAINNVRIWRRAMSAAEVGRVASGYAPESSSELAAYWPLNDGAGRTSRDLGPHALPLVFGTEGLAPEWIDFQRLAEGPYFELKYLLDQGLPEFPGAGGEPVVVDASNDGLPDVFIINRIPKDRFECLYPYYKGEAPAQGPVFRNKGSNFVLDPSLVEFTHFSSTNRTIERDFTGDGRIDAFVMNSGPEPKQNYGVECRTLPDGRHNEWPGGQSRLFVAHADGKMREETSQRLPQRISFDHGGTAADFDGDKDIDILLVTGNSELVGPCKQGRLEPGAPCPVIFVNDGTGKFTEQFSTLPRDVTTHLVSGGERFYLSATAFDADNDGDADLLLGGQSPNFSEAHERLLLNDGTGRFTDAPAGSMPNRPVFASDTSAIWLDAGDINRDGWNDIVATHYTRVVLYLNNGNGTFRDATQAIPPGGEVGSNRCNIVDLNADGWPDIACADDFFRARVRLFYNRGDGAFEQMPLIDALSLSGVNVNAVDADGDGDTDLIGGVGPWTWTLYQRKPYKPVPPR